MCLGNCVRTVLSNSKNLKYYGYNFTLILYLTLYYAFLYSQNIWIESSILSKVWLLMVVWRKLLYPVPFPEAAMKAGLHHRTHQVLAYTLTSDSLMPVKLWPLAVVAQRLLDLWNQKTRWGMGGGGQSRVALMLMCWQWVIVSTPPAVVMQPPVWYAGTTTLCRFNIDDIMHSTAPHGLNLFMSSIM